MLQCLKPIILTFFSKLAVTVAVLYKQKKLTNKNFILRIPIVTVSKLYGSH